MIVQPIWNLGVRVPEGVESVNTVGGSLTHSERAGLAMGTAGTGVRARRQFLLDEIGLMGTVIDRSIAAGTTPTGTPTKDYGTKMSK